jgi:type I restriction enzyme R subunit
LNFDVEPNDEGLKSELPALQLLTAMGYQYFSRTELSKTRRDFREVLLYDRLETSLRKLNREIDEDGILEAMVKITESSYPYSLDIVETNEKIHAKLVGLSRSGGLEPITVRQNLGDGPVEKTIRLIDFDEPDRNDFVVTNQFILDGFKYPIRPDIVLFVNGIPLVIIECKSPSIPGPIEEAVHKNFQHYQTRGLGYERLFYYNHFMVATCGTLARYGTVGANVNQFARWSESYPLSDQDVEKLCGQKPREQEFLIAGMLSRSHLLDLLKNYVTYEEENNKKIKKIAKHQQYRAVTKSVSRLNLEQSISDKGGVIWHTQGSGKSLTMLWLATQLMFKFGNPPIIIVTDRRQLDRQIHNTFKICGFPEPEKARTAHHLSELLANPRGKTIMTTIQKFATEVPIHTDEKVIVLVDEGHRTQYKYNAEDMRMAMPNAVFFAFTGTPIDKKNKSTYKVFGPLLDRYAFEESKADGATLRIVYDGRLPNLFIEGGDTVDSIFERVFIDLDEETRGKLKSQYVTKESIAEASARIRKICIDLVDHYRKTILPNRYKAMIVAPSREAAVLYKRELDKLNAPKSRIIMTSILGERGKDGTNWDEYYLSPEQREAKADDFKKIEDPTKILIVVDMLLVGYDVPIVQVLYLDQGLKEHNLLQAIARVNRPFDERKTFGLIVDYSGITKELQKALAMFDEQDIQGALEPIAKELEELRQRHLNIMLYLKDLDVNNDNAIIEKFESADFRDKFEYDFKMFSKALDAILPSKEADPYISDFKLASKIRQMIRTYYGGVSFDLREYGKKVQQLIDDYIRSLNVSELINPREITFENFLSYAAKFESEEAKTALVKDKARQIIRELAPNNPAYYEKLRERLEKLIQEEESRRKETASYFSAFKEIYEAALHENKEREKLGFKAPFEFAVYEELQLIRQDQVTSKKLTEQILEKILPETRIIGWKDRVSSEKAITESVYDLLLENEFPEEKVGDVIRKIINLAKHHL